MTSSEIARDIDVSIIYVNYNTRELLLDSIASVIEKSSGFSYEIIVVDNNSADSPENSLKERFPGKVTYIQLNENIGFGRANNEGIKMAGGRNIFLLNTDTYLLNNAISILCDYIDSHPEVGSCGANLYTESGEPTYSYHKIPYGIRTYELSQLTKSLSIKFVSNAFFNSTQEPLEVGNVTGACFMVLKSVLDEVGAFDPIFFMYCEESELSWRIRKAGYKNVNVPQAKIVHLEGRSSASTAKKKCMELDGRRKYYIKTRGRAYFRFANALLFSAIIMRLAAYRLSGMGASEQYAGYKQLLDILTETKFRGSSNPAGVQIKKEETNATNV